MDFIDWFYEGYNPEDFSKPDSPTRQVERKRRKSRFEVLVQFMIPNGLLGWVFWNLYLALPVHTWLILLGSVLIYFLVSFVIYPVENPDRYNLPNPLLNHPFRLAKTEHGFQRILTLLLTPGWLMSKTIVRFFTLLRNVSVRGKKADQLYYSTNLYADRRWILPGVALIVLAYTPFGDLQIPSFENDVGFVLTYIAGFLIIFGIRARNAFIEVCHKIIATFWAVPPTFFLAGSIFALSALIPSILFLTPGDQGFFQLIYDMRSEFFMILVLASLTFATWTLTRHLVYEKYSREIGKSDAHLITLVLLYFFGGAFGLHRFYTNRIITGVLYMGTMGLFGIGLIYDGILLAFGTFEKS